MVAKVELETTIEECTGLLIANLCLHEAPFRGITTVYPFLRPSFICELHFNPEDSSCPTALRDITTRRKANISNIDNITINNGDFVGWKVICHLFTFA